MKHTPGPWEVSGAGTFVKLRADNKAICRMNHGGVWEWATEKGSIEDQANAQRIVDCVNGCAGITNPLAIPKLLEACKPIVNEFESQPNPDVVLVSWEAVKQIRQTIAEATEEG